MKWEEKIHELEVEIENLHGRNSALNAAKDREVEQAKEFVGGIGAGGFVLGLVAFYIGSSVLGGKPPNSKYVDIQVDSKPLSTVIEESNEKNLLMLGTMKCTDHDPTHAAATHAERKELTKTHGCQAWSFTGRLTNDLRGLHAFEIANLKTEKKPDEKSAD